MSAIELLLLGPFQALVDGEPARFRSDKVRALLAYLALSPDQPHRRETLAALLWPDMPDSVAHNNLRKSLHRLKESLGDTAAESLLTVDRQSVQLNSGVARVDASTLLQRVATCESHAHRHLFTCQECLDRLNEAQALYRGELLAGFAVSDSLGFEEWLALQRERLLQRVLVALYNLAEAYTERGEPALAGRFAARQIALEPWREEAYRQLMRALAADGRRSEALAQYDLCRRALADAFGVEPAPETTSLYEALQCEAGAQPEPSSSMRGFPLTLTPLIGRSTEVAHIVQRLLDPDCRLLTLNGPGGIGKTRLALHTAQTLASRSRFTDGIVFVSAESLSSMAELQAALAQTLQLRFHEDAPLNAQLAEHLRDKQVLLVLDGFEPLASDAGALAEWLSIASRLKLLVTSRERLNLRAEWLLPIEGLGVPAADEQPRPGEHGAIGLFLELAGRIRPDFAPGPADLDAIRRVCRAVEGLPLGIEIAAAWLRHSTPEAIAELVESHPGDLEAPLRDMPARHLSLRVVFEHSWQRLAVPERQQLARLAVVRGAFDAEVAQAVGDADRAGLSALIDKSLLQHTPDGRYRMHEQLRKFALEKAEAVPGFDSHSAYFLTRVAQVGQAFFGPDPRHAATVLTSDLDNVRQAWRWALAHTRAEIAHGAAEGLAAYYLFAGLLGEGESTFAIDDNLAARCPRLAAELLAHRADFASRVGRLPEAQTHVRRAVELDPSNVFACIMRGRVRELQGRHVEALVTLEEACAMAVSSGNSRLTALALNRLANVHWRMGAYPAAIKQFQQALQLDRDVSHQVGQAMHLGNLGIVLREQSEYARAETCLQQALDIDQALGNELGTARHLNNLGLVRWQTGRRAEALDCYRQALSIAERLRHARGIASCISNIGILHRERGEYVQAIQAYERALQLARDAGARANISNNLKNLGNTYRELADYAQARRYYAEAELMDIEDGNTEGLARLWGYRATLSAETHDLLAARSLFERGVEALRELGARYYLAWQLVDLADVCLSLGDASAAMAFAREGAEVSRAAGRDDYAVRARAITARALHADGQTEVARALLIPRLPEAAELERAVLNEALWQIDGDREHASAALEAYEALTTQTPSAHNRARVDALRRALGR